jgi:nitroreductase
MEVKRVIGNRRSIRFYLPFRPVERSKIQKMQEAGRRASCVGNVTGVQDGKARLVPQEAPGHET